MSVRALPRAQATLSRRRRPKGAPKAVAGTANGRGARTTGPGTLRGTLPSPTMALMVPRSAGPEFEAAPGRSANPTRRGPAVCGEVRAHPLDHNISWLVRQDGDPQNAPYVLDRTQSARLSSPLEKVRGCWGFTVTSRNEPRGVLGYRPRTPCIPRDAVNLRRSSPDTHLTRGAGLDAAACAPHGEGRPRSPRSVLERKERR